MNDIDVADIGAAPRPRPWGYWATFGWAILAAVLSAIIALLAVLWRRHGILSESIDLANDGQLRSFMTTVSDAVQIGALAVAARLAQWPPGQYRGLIRPSGRDALGAVALYLPGFDALTYLLGRDIVTPFQVTSYLSARDSGALPLLWFTSSLPPARKSCSADFSTATGFDRNTPSCLWPSYRPFGLSVMSSTTGSGSCRSS
jgi:hypothetical protein